MAIKDTGITTKDRNKLLRELVYQRCEEKGFWNVDTKALAAELDTNQSNVYLWKKNYVNQSGLLNVQKFAKELNVTSREMIHELARISRLSINLEVRMKAINLFFESVNKYTSFLENFGYKEKVADLHGIIEFAKIELVEPENMKIKEVKVIGDEGSD